MHITKIASAVLSLAAFAPFAHADVRLPAIIGDNMVLQRDQKVPIWGWADPGEKVTVTTLGEKAEATAGQDGKWSVTLGGLKTSEQPIDMTIAGKNTITLKNILVGDVWVASGQSNMEWALKNTNHAGEETPKSTNPKIRLFIVPRRVAFDPQDDISNTRADHQGRWLECTPENTPNFSAVGYWFAKDIVATQNTPVGMIGTYWGGTSAQAWTSPEALATEPATKALAETAARRKENLQADLEKFDRETLPAWEANRKKWDQEVAEANKKWQAEVEAAKAAGQPAPPKPTVRPAPRRPARPDNNPGTPGGLFHGMVAPIVPYAIKGVIWYQGESNAGQPEQYQKLFPLLINDWRNRWGQGQFPFLWVQLANYQKRQDQPTQSSRGWAGLREAQSMTLSLPATGQAVIIDIGEERDIHPRDKKNVGHRLALAARKVAYGEDIVYSGPVYDSMKVEGDKIRLTFKHVGGGLTIGSAPATRPSVDPEPPLPNLVGFAIAGADRKFVWADATIDGDTVVVSSPQVSEPVAVRYAWADNPVCNLYNKEGLPASPFRTDDWQDPPAPAKK